MDTFVLEHDNRIFLTSSARVVTPGDADMASNGWEISEASPYVKWVAGSYVRSEEPNSNKQFWTTQDLEFGDYSIRYSPFNMLHRTQRPVGFFLETRRVFDEVAAATKPFTVEALAGMWTHVFPLEASLLDQASEKGLLFLSMECRSEKIRCAGDNGCGETFDYLDTASHCEHIKERASVRHLVKPTFRGGAAIIPPVRPGWKGAKASVLDEQVKSEARRYAKETEAAYESARKSSEVTAGDWEALMGSIIQLA